MLAMLMGQDLLILGLIVVLVFGSSQLPKLARSVGEASKELKKVQHDEPAKAIAVPEDDERVTLTKAELEALLQKRDAARLAQPSA